MADILFAEKEFDFAENTSYGGGVFQAMDAMDAAIMLIELVAGSTYTVIWDGVKYECVARGVNFYNGDEIEIGNASIVGLEDSSSEPFVLGYSPSMSMNLLYTNVSAGIHTIAVYDGILEEEKVGANIVLFDRNGSEVTYEGIETVTFNTDVEGETATYTHGTAVSDVPVELDLSGGNQTVKAETGKLMKSVVVQKPETLLAENIKKGVEVAGVEGTLIGEGVSKTVELDFSEGNQTVLPDEETLLSEVVIEKPEELVPENIAKGIEIAGVTGNMEAGELDGYFTQTLKSVFCSTTTMIPLSAFSGFSELNEVKFPECSIVNHGAFMSCSALAEISFPKCSSVGNSAFYSCSSLSEAAFPVCKSVGMNTFRGCQSIENISFPLCTYAAGGAFYGCIKLKNAILPLLSLIAISTFAYCNSLEMASFPACTALYGSAFYSSKKLMSLYLLGANFATLSNVNAFTSTPLSISSLTGSFGSIFVREEMLATYKTMSNWSAYSNRFVGLTNEEIAELGG